MSTGKHVPAPWVSILRSAAWAASLVLAATPAWPDSIVHSPHNLSVSGPGTVKAATETEICVFCHAPHGGTAEAPLWNRTSSGTMYATYSSSTAKGVFGQPTGASKLCLSCHDGTVALGLVRSRTTPISFSGGVSTMPLGRSNLGIDLSDDHPISFVYDRGLVSLKGELRDPNTLAPPVRLDRTQQLQCTACHNAHDNRFGKFLVESSVGSSLCLACHDKRGWPGSSHQASTATWDGTGPDPWPRSDLLTVAANGCASCHASHTADHRQMLLNLDGEEQACYVCHNGHVASKNVQTAFAKFSVHPVAGTTGVHDPTEDAINPPRHVECVDCHDAHAVSSAAATAPNASGALAGVRGINTAGSVVSPLQKEYELCFRCHADSTARGAARVNRQFPQTNTRLEFQSTSLSYHPVTAIGKNTDVPNSLILPYTTSSIIYCTDCHNNDAGPGAGGTGPNGPHGSAYTPILERNLSLADNSGYSASLYAMCYKCHDETSITEDRSFPLHHKHVVDKQAACTTCHDPHGVVTKTHLINFNLTYVSPSSNGRLEYIDGGSRSGSCSLTCHGRDHVNQPYAP